MSAGAPAPAPPRRHWRWAAAAAAVAIVAALTFRSTLGHLAYRHLPRTWYYRMIEIKDGDPAPRTAVAREDLAADPLVVLVIGQSNGGNYGSGTDTQEDRRVLYFHRGALTVARDPAPGSTGSGGSPWGAVGRRIADATGREVVFAVAVAGATRAAEWSPGGRCHPLVEERLRALRKASLEPGLVLWQQGEADTEAGTPQRDYEEALRGLVAWLRAQGVGAPVLVAQASHSEGRTSEAVRAAQAALLDASARVFAGPDTDTLGAAMRRDGTHFTAEGTAALAELWAARIGAAIASPAAAGS